MAGYAPQPMANDPEQPPDPNIQLSLVENAVDFLKRSVEEVLEGRDDHRGYKYGLLHLCDGIELLLKCRLSNEGWEYVVADPKKTTEEKFNSGNFISVYWDDAIERVEDVTGQEFDAKTLDLLRRMRVLRNEIQHFRMNINDAECDSLLAAGLAFALSFIDDHLDEEGLEEQVQELRQSLASFKEYVDARLAEVSVKVQEASRYSYSMDCPRCLQLTLYSDGDESKCLYCGYISDGETTAREWVETFRGRPLSLKDEMTEPSIEDCPDCMRTACVEVAKYVTRELPVTHFCFNCGNHGDYKHCAACGNLFSDGGEDQTGCDRCIEYRANRDD